MTNLTPAQLEEFESTFRYFDKEESNTLNLAEMIAALASLGIVYSEGDMDLIFNQLVSEYGAVTFEAFINLLVESFIPLCEIDAHCPIGGDNRRPDISRPTAGRIPWDCQRQGKNENPISEFLLMHFRSHLLQNWTSD